jgi:hypothetical protein
MRDSEESDIEAALARLVLVKLESLARSLNVFKALKPSMQIMCLQFPQARKRNTLKPCPVPLLTGEANCLRCVSLMHVSERSELACFSNTCGYLGTRTMTTPLGYTDHQSARRQSECMGRSKVLAEHR